MHFHWGIFFFKVMAPNYFSRLVDNIKPNSLHGICCMERSQTLTALTNIKYLRYDPGSIYCASLISCFPYMVKDKELVVPIKFLFQFKYSMFFKPYFHILLK